MLLFFFLLMGVGLILAIPSRAAVLRTYSYFCTKELLLAELRTIWGARDQTLVSHE